MQARWRVAWAGLFFTACADAASIWIGLPEVPGAESMVVAVEVERTARRFLIDLQGGAAVRTALEVEDGAALEVVALSETPGELGVEPGEVEGGAESTCGLPKDTLGHFSASLPGERDVAWSPRDAAGPLIADLELPDAQGRCRCPRFTLEVDVIPDPALVRFAIPVLSGRVLAVMAQGSLRLFDSDEGARSSTIARPAELEGVELTTGATDPDGGAWLASIDGRVWRVSSEDPLSVSLAVELPRRSSVDALVVVDAAGPTLVTLGSSGRLDVFADGSWNERHDFGGSGPLPRLAFDPQSEDVLAILSGPIRAVLVQHDAAIPLPAPNFRRVARSLAYSKALGFVVGGDEGELARLRGGAWEVLADEGTLRGVYALRPHDRGIYYGGDFGFLASWHARAGRCLLDVRAAEPIGVLEPLGRDLISLPAHRDFETRDTKVSRFRYELP